MNSTHKCIMLLVVCAWHHQKHDYANYDQFAPKYHLASKTIQCVSVPNLNLFGPTDTELRRIFQILDQWIQSYGEFYHVIWENELVGIHGCRNIDVWRSSKLWTVVTLAFVSISTWNLQIPFKIGLYILCKKFVKEVVNVNFWWRHCKAIRSLLTQVQNMENHFQEWYFIEDFASLNRLSGSLEVMKAWRRQTRFYFSDSGNTVFPDH